MLNLKKTAVAVLALGSSAAFAGTMGPVCSAVNVTVPCESTAWDFGGRALYLQPAVGNDIFGSENTVTINGSSASFGHNAPWNWGFMIEGSYHFNTGNDLNLNWYHLNRSSTRTLAASGPFAATIGTLATLSTSFGETILSTDPHWDAVNIEFGQHVDFGENKSIRFHGGGQYARLTNSSTAAGSASVSGTLLGLFPVAIAETYSVASNPSYNGFGPRVGADMSYDWGNGLGIYANAAGALLAGSLKQSLSVGLGGTVPVTASASSSSTLVVPELEGKIGANYTYAMAQGDLTLDAGWLWINYFNVLNSDVNNGSFALQGPYFGLKWLGNVA